MSHYSRQFAAAAAAYDNASPDDYEDARDEAIAERTEELVKERLADDKHVQDAIADALANDYDDVFASALRRFYIAFDEADTNDRMADAGYSLFRDLKQYVEPAIRSDAESDALAEQAAFEARAAA